MWLLFVQVFFAIFGVMDPVGNVPVFITLTGKMDRERQARLATAATVRAGVILFIFVFLGSAILNAFQISIESFRIAGGLILMLLGLQILFGKEHEVGDAEADLSVVPLATPLIAGPGMITSAVILAKEYGYFLTLAGIVANLIISRILFRYSHLVLRVLGKKGALAAAKVMGLIITAIGVEFIRNALGVRA